MNIEIREEQGGDRCAVRRINRSAIGSQAEANIVDKLRDSCGNLISLIATVDSLPVGHILFTPVSIEGPENPPVAMGLAPMAVLPLYQHQGIGS